MHKVKKQRSGELLVKNILILNIFSMVIIKNYKMKKKLFNKFPEISGKIRINFRKFSENFPREIFLTHDPTFNAPTHRGMARLSSPG